MPSVIPSVTVIPRLGEGSLLQIHELERLELLLSDEAFSADAARRTAERAGFIEASARIEGSARIEMSSRASARDLSSPGAPSSLWEGYLIVGDELRPLPIGSTLDASAGVFSWLPGPGFLGDYRLAFIDRSIRAMVSMTVRIEPRFSGRQ